MNQKILINVILCCLWLQSRHSLGIDVNECSNGKANSQCTMVVRDSDIRRVLKKDDAWKSKDFKRIFVTNCQMDDLNKVWKNTTAQCSLHPNTTNSLMFIYNLACEKTNATLRLPADLSIIFPKLEKLRIDWSYDRRGRPFTCPKPQMDSGQRWPRNLSKIIINNLPTAYLPAIRNSQVKHFEIITCGNLTQIANVSSLKSLENLKIHCEYKSLHYLPPGVFKENVKLKELDLNGNNISIVDADSLKGLVNLETINLGLNPIEYVPKGFFSYARNLKIVKWEQNECDSTGKIHWSENMISPENSKLEQFLYSHDNRCTFTMNPRAILLPSNNSLQQLKIENIGMNFTSLENFLELNNLSLLSDLDLSSNALKQIGNLTKNLPSLQKLDVTGNPYTPCDCETFLNLEYMNKVLTLKYESCPNKTIEDCQNKPPGLTVTIIIFASLVILIFFIILIIRKYFKNYLTNKMENIMAWFYHHKVFHRMFKENSEMYKKWDVALFYHVPNSNVQTTIQRLKQCDRAYKITFRDQDFTPGVSVHEESLRLMTHSKSIIFFLTKKFFMCQQCCEDLKYSICSPDFSKRLILLNIERDQDLFVSIEEEIIKQFLVNNGYLDFKEKNGAFWNKLQYKLPHKKPRNSMPISATICNIFTNRQMVSLTDTPETEETVELNVQTLVQ